MHWNVKPVDIRDERGKLVAIGDVLAVPFDRKEIRLGRVVKYIERPNYLIPDCFLEMEWLFGTGTLPAKNTTIEVYTQSNCNRLVTMGCIDYWKWNRFYRVILPD